MGILLTAATFTFGLQFAGFLVAAVLQTEVFYDILGGVNFLVLGWIGYPTRFAPPLLKWVTAVFCISRGWLLVFLAWRAHHRKGDSRFDNVKNQPPLFFVYWMVQACWVYSISMPLLVMQSQSTLAAESKLSLSTNQPLSTQQVALLMGFAASVLMEISSDIQKTLWIQRGRVGGFCTDGWWNVSRHPNYAGEILQWWCAALLAIGSWIVADSSLFLPWTSLVSPLFTMHILLNLSGTGVWNAEGKNLKRYYDTKDVRETYIRYRATTPPLFPMVIPGVSYERLPLAVKRRWCFEWEVYEYKEK